MAWALADAEAHVVVWGTRRAENDMVLGALRAAGARVDARAGLGDEATVEVAFAETARALGHVDASVANAGT
jgi:NAD(P)-dependent dehydrogenase (short-subunit alcohol dehydrogenase family)